MARPQATAADRAFSGAMNDGTVMTMDESDMPPTQARITSRLIDSLYTEAMLLAELMRHAGNTVSKERLLSSVWGYSFHPESNVVDVYVRRLRTKLESDVISTVRGVGYRIDIG